MWSSVIFSMSCFWTIFSTFLKHISTNPSNDFMVDLRFIVPLLWFADQKTYVIIEKKTRDDFVPTHMDKNMAT